MKEFDIGKIFRSLFDRMLILNGEGKIFNYISMTKQLFKLFSQSY